MQSKILVIDDEVEIRESVQERLKIEGYDVFIAPDGRKGLRCYQEHQFDLVITDVLMPELDGLEVVRTLRGSSSTLPILVMSGGGNHDLDYLVEAIEFGATQTLSKPFRLEELVSMVHHLLNPTPTPSLPKT